MLRSSLLLFVLAGMASGISAQPDCSQTSTGHIPINDLGTGTYLGMTGGLYANGSNFRPPAHQAAGLAFAAQVQPLDASGMPDPVNGKVAWLSIGFSNATMETQAFIPLATALPDLDPHLVLVDGALGGQTCTILSTTDDQSYAPYWNTVADRLSSAGVTAEQVQAIWFKDANIAGNTPVQEYADTMLVQCKRIMHEFHTRFPNAHLCYVASRIYAGYATTGQNPEPYAYRSGWTMKQLIADQVNGDPLCSIPGRCERPGSPGDLISGRTAPPRGAMVSRGSVRTTLRMTVLILPPSAGPRWPERCWTFSARTAPRALGSSVIAVSQQVFPCHKAVRFPSIRTRPPTRHHRRYSGPTELHVYDALGRPWRAYHHHRQCGDRRVQCAARPLLREAYQ
jgi:hypothetical protein